MEFTPIRLSKELPSEDYLKLSPELHLKSLPELISALETMEEEFFIQHVSKQHNDFGDWILEAYGDEILARKINRTRKKTKMIRLLQKAVKQDEGKSDVQVISIPRKKKEVLRTLVEVYDEM